MDQVRGVLLDIDGVLVVSWEPLPGAADTLDWLRSQQLPLRFLTNTTSATQAEIGDRLRGAGLDVADAEILTAGVATAEHLARTHPGRRCYVLNDGPSDDLDAAGVHAVDDAAQAEVVVLGAGGPSFTWEAISAALRALRAGAALVAMHGSRLWQTADGAFLDGGAYTAMLAEAAGVEPVVVGKPAPTMFTAALEAIGCPPERACMVGDDVQSDVRAAQRLGVTGVLVRTGKFHESDLRDGEPPDEVIDSIADLPTLLR